MPIDGLTRVAIHGDGVAAYCCAHVLKSAGCLVKIDPTERPRLPAILLSDAALALIRDVFGKPDLLLNLPRVKQRVVAWGDVGEIGVFEHSAVVVSESVLLESLRQGLALDHFDQPDWTVFASRPLPAGVREQRFGSRAASAVQVELRAPKEGIDPSACWIEALEEGWLFLIPTEPSSGWLLSVGQPPERLLARSRAVSQRVVKADEAKGEFPASPCLVTPLCAPGWLACGTAAMAFDPICGDGTANAIREAILASAVVRAAARGEDTGPMLSHYETRLTIGFQRHLALCRDFYRTGHSGEWWEAELVSLQEGLEWCARQTGGSPEFRYQLSGFDLTPVTR